MIGFNIKDNLEMKKPELENFKNIKPESGMTKAKADGFWNKVFDNLLDKFNVGDSMEKDKIEKLDEAIGAYSSDLKSKSEFPETIPDKPFEATDLKIITPEENSEMRTEFDNATFKENLKKQWEEKNGKEWPKYDHDIYSSKGNRIRKAGDDYDMHHIHPLCYGGKNEVDNITPLSAEVHYDRQGVHAVGSPYDKIGKILGGINE